MLKCIHLLIKAKVLSKKVLGLLFLPTNAQTYIVKHFVSTPTCFSASAMSSGSLNFVLAEVTNY